MSKSTLFLVVIATLILGALIGVAVVNDQETATDGAVATTAVDLASLIGESAVAVRFLRPDDVEVEYDEFGTALPSLSGANFVGGRRAWRQDTTTVTIPADGSVEYKALMDRGDSLSFTWSVDDGEAYYDFHAHDAAFGEDFFTRYDEGEGRGSSGTIIAPYSGQHGWFWLNLEADPITITLETAGFYERIIEIELDAAY
ncbi:MAG: hypothetical protein AAGA44_18095 [Pseudomonadota bacterium]